MLQYPIEKSKFSFYFRRISAIYKQMAVNAKEMNKHQEIRQLLQCYTAVF